MALACEDVVGLSVVFAKVVVVARIVAIVAPVLWRFPCRINRHLSQYDWISSSLINARFLVVVTCNPREMRLILLTVMLSREYDIVVVIKASADELVARMRDCWVPLHVIFYAILRRFVKNPLAIIFLRDIFIIERQALVLIVISVGATK